MKTSTSERARSALAYEQAWSEAQSEAALLHADGGLAAVLRWLAQTSRGDAPARATDAPTSLRLEAPNRRPPHFWVQVNPRRRQRPQALSLRGHAAAAELPDTLDRESVRAASGGRQVGIEIRLGRRHQKRIALAQRFPLAPAHCVIAAASGDETQYLGAGGTRDGVDRTVRDLADIALSLGHGWLAYFNGAGAGATQRRWHVQVLERPAGWGPLPLELASTDGDAGPEGALPLVRDYPVATLALRGTRGSVTAAAAFWVRQWLRSAVPRGAGSVNLIATAMPAGRTGRQPQLSMWIVPRRGAQVCSPQFTGQLASIEMLGMIVLSDEADLRRLANDGISYDMIAAALRSVQPPGVVETLAAFARHAPPLA